MSDKPNRNCWETPLELFAVLNEEYKFTLDAAASYENAKCERYFTRDDDALVQCWTGESVFVNPPYGRGPGCHGLEKWVAKCEAASLSGANVVLLAPCDPSTRWFSSANHAALECRLLTPRPQFVPPPGVTASSSPSTTAAFIFAPMKTIDCVITLWDWKKQKT